jgi:hypothetical protein
VSRFLAWIIAGISVALTGVLGLGEARTISHAPGAPARVCHPRLTVVAHAQGSPDDLVWDGRTLLVSDINQGTIGVVAHGRVRTVVAHIREPEGIVPGPRHSLIVAEQATNRVLEIRLPKGRRTTPVRLPLPPR